MSATTATEHWIGLVSHRGYDVSTLGRVRSYWTKGRRPKLTDKPRIISPFRARSGHMEVTLHAGSVGRARRRKVHHLVLDAFVGPRPEGAECLHGDGDPSNNRPENLRWGTRRENIDDMFRHGVNRRLGTRGEAHRSAKLTEDEVREIVRLRKAGHGIVELGRMFGLDSSNISRIANRRTWRHLTI